MRKLCLLALLAMLPAAADTWALIVGVEEYEDSEITPLQYAVADAEAVAARLEAAGIERGTLRVLTSSSLEPTLRPTRNNVLNAIAGISDRAKADDTFVFFFAGHGLQRGEGRPALLLTVDTNRRLPDQTALAVADLEQALAMLPCRRVLLLLDACRNNPDAGRGEGDNRLGDDLARNLRPTVTGGARAGQQSACVFACDVGQRAWEMGSAGHGAFTNYLLEAMAGAAAGDDDMITVGEAVEYVASRLQTWCAERGKPLQSPVLFGDAAAWPLVRAPRPHGVSLALDTDPPGARVYLDARDTGLNTPCKLAVPFSGDVTTQTVWLEFRRIGYRSKRLEVTVDRRRGAEVPMVRLERVQPVVEDPLDPVPVPLSLGPRVAVPAALLDEAVVRGHLEALSAAVRRWAQANGNRFPPSLKWPETLADFLPDDLLALLRSEQASYAYAGAPAGLPLGTDDPRTQVIFFESDVAGPWPTADPLLAAYNRRGDRTHLLVRGDGAVATERVSGADMERLQREAEARWWLRALGEGVWQLALRAGYPDPSRWTVSLVQAGLWPASLPAQIRANTVFFNSRLKGRRPADLASLDATPVLFVARGQRTGFDTTGTAQGLGGVDGRDECIVLTAAGWTQTVSRAQLATLLAAPLPEQVAPAGPSLFDRTQENLEVVGAALRRLAERLGRLPTGDRWQDMLEAELRDTALFSLPEHPNCYALNPWLAGRAWPDDPASVLLYETDRAERNTSSAAEQAVPSTGWHHGKVAVLTVEGKVVLLPPEELKAMLRGR